MLLLQLAFHRAPLRNRNTGAIGIRQYTLSLAGGTPQVAGRVRLDGVGARQILQFDAAGADSSPLRQPSSTSPPLRIKALAVANRIAPHCDIR
jgi:hypothetical protein